jgi:branched-chain amino acid transport system substrate-binding protein
MGFKLCFVKKLLCLGIVGFFFSCTTSIDRSRAAAPKAPETPKRLEGATVDNEVLTSTGKAAPAPQVSYRNVADPEDTIQVYRDARAAQDAGDLRKAEELWAQYVRTAPTGQFVDLVSLRMAQQSFERHDYRQAALHYQRVAELDPPSQYRGQGFLGWAKSLKALGETTRALEVLARIDFREIPVSTREEVFNLWSEVAADAGRWLESTLASIKAYWESRDPAQQRHYAAVIREQIDRRLVEGELKFVLNEYPNRFPSNELRLRLATLYLARAEKPEAEMLLNAVLSSSDAGSEPYRQARALLDRLNTFDQVSSYKIGALLPLSGRQAALGRAVADGLELAFHGKKIELVLADSGPSRESLKVAFDRLVMEDRVMLVVGPIGGEDGELVAQWSSQYGVPNVNLSSRPGILDQGSYVFRTALTPEKQVRALVRYSREKLKAKRFAVLFPQDNFGEAYAQEYFNAVRMMGGEITAAESYDPKQSDFKVQIENMVGKAFAGFRKQELDNLMELEKERLGRELTARERGRFQVPPIVDFDILFIPDTYRPLGQIIPALLYADVTQPLLMGPATWRNPRLLDRAGQYLNKAFFVDAYAPDRQNPVTQFFVEQFQIRNGAVPSSLNAVGYDVGLSLVAAYQKGGRVPSNREELRSRLEYLGEVQGVLGKHRWDRTRDTLAELQFFRTQRGAFVHQGFIEL